MDTPARLKRTGGFPKKQRDAPRKKEPKEPKEPKELKEPKEPKEKGKRETIAKSQGALYQKQCPRCNSCRIAVCMCYLADRQCLKCDHRWHICFDLIHMTDITDVATHAGSGCTFCREMHKSVYL